MSTHPTDLRALIDRLRAHPWVEESSTDSRVRGGGPMRFVRQGQGGLWFRTEHGVDRYLPVDCGRVASESGFEFRPAGFSVVKFGVTISYIYLSDKESRP